MDEMSVEEARHTLAMVIWHMDMPYFDYHSSYTPEDLLDELLEHRVELLTLLGAVND